MNVLELAESRGLTYKRVGNKDGGEYQGPCPGCGDFLKPDSNRFHIWPNQNNGNGSFWCRQCEKAGDNITFLMEFEGLNFQEACRQLDRQMRSTPYKTPHIPKQSRGIEEFKPKSRPGEPNAIWQEKSTKFYKWAHDNLIENRNAKSFLKRRGINLQSIKKYKLGWNPHDLFRPRGYWGLATEIKKDGKKKKLWLPEGLVIPLIINDRILRIRIRRPQGVPRYYLLPGSSIQCLFVNKQTRAVVVVESELDAILLEQMAGDLIDVMALGSSGTKPDTQIIQRLQARSLILMCLDYDHAGAKALPFWQNYFPQTKRWPVPKGDDPCEAYIQGVDIRQWIMAGLPPSWRAAEARDGPYGRSTLGLKNKKEGAEKEKLKAESSRLKTKEKLPNSVIRLAELLTRHPVAIINTPNRIALKESRAWARDNWEISKEISQLVYFDADVFHYLAAKSANLITKENII